MHDGLRKNWVTMLPDRRVAFEDGLPSFGLYLGDFETEAREKILDELRSGREQPKKMGVFHQRMDLDEIINTFNRV